MTSMLLEEHSVTLEMHTYSSGSMWQQHKIISEPVGGAIISGTIGVEPWWVESGEGLVLEDGVEE